MLDNGVAGEIRPVILAPLMTVNCFKTKSSAVSVSNFPALGRRDKAPSLPSVLPVFTMTLVFWAEQIPENKRAAVNSKRVRPDAAFLLHLLFTSFSLVDSTVRRGGRAALEPT